MPLVKSPHFLLIGFLVFVGVFANGSFPAGLRRLPYCRRKNILPAEKSELLLVVNIIRHTNHKERFRRNAVDILLILRYTGGKPVQRDQRVVILNGRRIENMLI